MDLYCGQEIHDLLAQLEDELRFVLLTSYARIHRETEKSDDAIHFKLSTNDEIWVAVELNP